MTPCERFGANLRRLRMKHDLSQERLAYLTEMHRTEISALERAKREPRLGTLLKLSAVLKAPPRDFFEGIEWSPILPPPASPGGFLVTSAREGGD
jgi:transcriptional regulator with XRE-family HTH domain